MISIAILAWVTLIVLFIAYHGRFGRRLRGKMARAFIGFILIYPLLEVTAVWVSFRIVGGAVGGATIYGSHSEVDGVFLIGGRRACSWDCYGLLQQGFNRVEMQITGEKIPDADGKTFQYFAYRPGIYGFELARNDDPRCSEYLSWASKNRIDRENTTGMDADFVVNAVILQNQSCLVANRLEQIDLNISVARIVFHRGVFLGDLREYRTSVFAGSSTEESPLLLAEDRSLQLRAYWPVTRFLLSIGDGVMRYEAAPMKVSSVVAPR